MSDGVLNRPRPIQRDDHCEDFNCGNELLNEYLQQFAWTNHRAGAARTYVATRGKRVIGYHTLAYASVAHHVATPRVRRGLAQHPIPVMLLARLAVDRGEQGRGLGKGLLKDALLRTVQAAEIAGFRAVIVHAKDAAARSFYERFGFEPTPLDSLHLMLLLKDILKVVSG